MKKSYVAEKIYEEQRFKSGLDQKTRIRGLDPDLGSKKDPKK
jgi:hypothetical protein